MMYRCLALAKNGLGSTYPNPLVGSVIVHKEKIIGEGWHRKSGEPHAEILAIQQVKDKSLLKKSTLFVNLEPCSHFGKTPPCAHQIVAYGIPKVVIGTRDYAAHVNGEGIRYLRANGVEVIENILQEESIELNKRFFTFHTKSRPYIILKFAQTHNGFFAPLNHQQKWITNSYSQQLVHKWRTEEQAILIGKNTAEIDQPQLNARHWHGSQPLRILIAEKLSPKIDSFIKSGNNTLIFTGEDFSNKYNATFVKINFKTPVLPQIMSHLKKINIQSMIVEGGATTLDYFIQANLWDEARILTGNVVWDNGIKSPILPHARLNFLEKIGKDTYHNYANHLQ